MKFKAPKREKISTQIVQQIRTAIMSGELKPGESLPHEQELMKELGVSKHTVREALRALEGMGFISIKRGAGGGPVVSEIDWSTARDFFASFFYFQNFTRANIFEVRILLEPYLTRKAAECIEEEHIVELKKIHQQCLDAFNADQEDLLYEIEVNFHVLLAKIAGNPILWATQDFVNNMLTDAKHHLKPPKDFSKQVLMAHERILTALENKDSESAAQAMYDHIVEVDAGLDKLENRDVVLGYTKKAV